MRRDGAWQSKLQCYGHPRETADKYLRQDVLCIAVDVIVVDLTVSSYFYVHYKTRRLKLR